MSERIRQFLGKAYRFLPDSLFARVQYFKYHKRILHLSRPRTYSEMLMWLKVHGRLERFAQFADKYAVRDYVARTIGPEYLVPQYGVWSNAVDIDFTALPKQFVLKATHGCNFNIIVKDKAKLDIPATRAKLNGWLQEDLYTQEREPQYKGIEPRIIAEQYLEDETGQLRDFKFYCVEGEPKLAQLDTDRFTNHKSELLTLDWRRQPGVRCATFEVDGPLAPKPAALPRMIEIARTLSREFWFVRVDLYLVGDRIYFGELTFTPGDGLVTFYPAKTGDQEFTRLLGVDYSKYAAYVK